MNQMSGFIETILLTFQRCTVTIRQTHFSLLGIFSLKHVQWSSSLSHKNKTHLQTSISNQKQYKQYHTTDDAFVTQERLCGRHAAGVQTRNLLPANIQNMRWTVSRETFEATYCVCLMKPSARSCAAPVKYTALFCVVGCVANKGNKQTKKTIFKFRKSYIHIDNNVKFIMYKCNKSLQSEKVIIFALPILAKKNRNQHL